MSDRTAGRLMLVEDNESNRKMILRRLRRQGYEVSGYADAESALAALEDETPDVLLMDISLPGMDGLEATRKLRGSPELNELPVVALTAHVREQDEERALEAGCDRFAEKPVEIDELTRIIEELLR